MTLDTIDNWLGDFGGIEYRLDVHSYNRMMKLMSLTNRIARLDNSTRRSIWVNISDENVNDTWINIVFHGNKYDVDDIYYIIEFDGIEVLSYDSKKSYEGEILDTTNMLNWLIETVEMVLSMAEKGEYESYISKVPYYRRRGVISRSKYYELVPDAREKNACSLSPEEITELLDSKGGPGSFVRGMTARKFYEACSVVYKALGLKKINDSIWGTWKDNEIEKARYGDVTPKEWYFATADYRDDGLNILPLDDEVAFAGWLRHKEPYFYWKYYGGHVWDIVYGFTDFSLYVEPDLDSDRCKLIVIGDSMMRSTEIIKAFLALRRAGYSVELQGYKVLTDRILEKDYLGVVEEAVNWRHGNTIAGHFARDEISLLDIDDLEIRNKLIEVIEWEELDEVKLETS